MSSFCRVEAKLLARAVLYLAVACCKGSVLTGCLSLSSLSPSRSSLKVVPVGMSKGIKKLLQEKFPNMSKFEDISELLMK